LGGGSSKAGSELTQSQRFTLKDIKGEAVSLDQVLSKNKAVLIDFWATWCGFCVEAMPELVKLQDKYQTSGFTVLAVNVGESLNQVVGFAEKMKLNFPVLLDEDMSVSRQYGIVGLPTTLLINAQGQVLGEYHEGSRFESDIEKALQ
jgi:peroxiredoxin